MFLLILLVFASLLKNPEIFHHISSIIFMGLIVHRWVWTLSLLSCFHVLRQHVAIWTISVPDCSLDATPWSMKNDKRLPPELGDWLRWWTARILIRERLEMNYTLIVPIIDFYQYFIVRIFIFISLSIASLFVFLIILSSVFVPCSSDISPHTLHSPLPFAILSYLDIFRRPFVSLF